MHLILDKCSFTKEVDDISLLVKNGAKINIQDAKGMTPLHLVVEHICAWSTDSPEIKIVKYLLEKGADATVKNNEGQTMLDIAHTKGRREKYAEIIEQYRNKNHKTE